MPKFFGLKFLFISIAIFLSCSLPVQAQFYNTQDGVQNGQGGDDTTFDDTENDPTANNGIGGGEDDAIFPPFGDIQSQYNSYNLDVLGDDLVGDNIDVDTGSLSLTQTDVSIPGNSGLPVAFGRSISRSGLRTEWLGGWTPQIPYISRNYVHNYGPSTDRCTGDLYPAMIEDNEPSIGYTIEAGIYFNGYDLNIPGRNPGALAAMSNGGAGSPEFVGSGARMVSKNNWKVTCLSGDANSGGERFLATAPNGDKYTFGFQQTYFERTTAVPAENPNLPYSETNPQRTNNTSADIQIRKDVLFVTRIEDVHNNWVDYEYLGDRPSKIISNDGREITFQYAGNDDKITSITTNPLSIDTDPRIWTYQYNASGLHKVILPDSRYWEMTTNSFAFSPWVTGLCAFTTSAEVGSVTIKHPSGTTALFDFERIVNGRTHADTVYLDAGAPGPTVEACFVGLENTLASPSGFHSFAVIKKTLTLSNNQTQIWTRDYEEDIGSFTFHSTHPADTKKRTITDPLGHKTVIHVNRRNSPLEGSIMKTEIIPAGQTVPIQTVDNTYIAGNQVGIPLAGISSRGLSNGSSVKRIYNTDIVTQRNGDTFTKQYDFQTDPAAADFAYGSPRAERSWSNYVISNQSKMREKITTYVHYKTNWILSKPLQITQNGRLLVDYGYDTNDLGLLVSKDEYGQRVEDYTYHPDGTFHTVTDALGRITEGSNWRRGKPQTIKRLVDTTTGTIVKEEFSTEIDGNGWGESLTDPSGNTTTYERDNMGRLTKIIPHSPPSGPSLPSTNIVYTWHASSIHQMITTGNKRNFVYYDSMYRPYLELTYDFTTAKYIWTRKEHDALGRLTFTSYPSPSSSEPDGMENFFDALGRVTETIESTTNAATQYEYLNGHRKKVTDPEGNITYTYSYGYDGPDTGDSYLIRQPLDVDTFTFRNVHGEISRVSQNGIQNGISLNKSQYFYYDDRRRLCRYRTPEGGDTLYGYNVGGEMTSYAKGQAYGTTCTAPSGTLKVDQSYDDLGHLETTTFNDGVTPNITRGYDLNSNLTLLTRGTTPNEVKWEYFYDSYNRITDEKLTLDSKAFDTAYSYNSLGHMVGKILPSGRYVSYTNDGLGRHVRVGELGANAPAYAENAVYHPSGQIDTLTFGNGQVFTQALDSRRMPFTLNVSKNGTAVQDMQYNYDLNARVQYQTNFLDADDTRYYQYDALGRLKQANSNRWAQADYTYDALGNLRSKHFSGWYNGVNGGPRTVTNSYNSKNQVSSSNDDGTVRTIAYDTRGNVTTLGNLAFVYDASDQPTVVTGGVSGNYVYDGNLKRVKSVIDGKTIYNVYDSTGRLVHVDEDTDGKQTDYLHGMGQTLARIKDDGTGDVFTYLHPDHLGSPQAGTNEAGGLAWNEHYTPFGEALIGNAANDNQGGFTGHIKDKATGLNYMQARYYDPKIGRFLSVDPVTFLESGNPANFNRYSYAFNNPINIIDPDGRYGWSPGEAERALAFGATPAGGAVRKGAVFAAEVGLTGGIGGTVAKQGATRVISGLSNQAKGKLGEAIVRVKIALKGQKMVARPQTKVSDIPGLERVTGRGADSVADFAVRGKDGATKVIDSKFTTTGNVSNTGAQRDLKRQIGDSFSNSVVHGDDVAAAAGGVGAVAGGAAGASANAAHNQCEDSESC